MNLSERLLSWLRKKFIFFPTHTIELYPGQFGLDYEDIHFPSNHRLKLHGWFLPGGPPNRTLIYFHGNAGNVGDRLDQLKLLHGIGMNIFIFDYRGYGISEGELSFDGVTDDSVAAYHYVLSRDDVDPNHIILYGESLGAAMAVHVALQEKHTGLILESPFTSIIDMRSYAYPFLPQGLAPDIYRSIDLIRHIHEPLLILHGDADTVVPFAMGKSLYEEAPPPKRFVPFAGAGHAELHVVATEKYLQAIETFLSEIGE
jgi:hypothetical protein